MAAYAEDAYGKAGLLPGVLSLLPLARDRERGRRELGARLSLRVRSRGSPSTPIDHLHRRHRAALADDGRQLRRSRRDRDASARSRSGASSSRSASSRSSAGSGSAARRSRRPGTRRGSAWCEGMGSSISLTLWAFLGLESAAQNSAAVENPKRDVPLRLHARNRRRRGHLHPVHDGDSGHRAERGARELHRPVRARLRPDVQPGHRLDRHGARRDGVSRFAARLAVHARPDRRRRRPTTACSRRFFAKANRLGAPIAGHGRHGRRPVADGAHDDLTEPQRAVQRARQPRRRHQRRAVSSSRSRRCR